MTQLPSELQWQRALAVDHDHSGPEEVMTDINAALIASREAIEQLIVSGERCGPAWSAPRAPGKWSPSQIVEHVARSLEESASSVTPTQKLPPFTCIV